MVPAWWLGEARGYARLIALREKIHARQALCSALTRMGLVNSMAGMIGVFALCAWMPRQWNFHHPYVLPALVAMVLGGLWLVSVGLRREVELAGSYARLWLRVSEAVKAGMVLVPALQHSPHAETAIEKALREDAQAAVRCHASGGIFEPHLKAFSTKFFVMRKVALRAASAD